MSLSYHRKNKKQKKMKMMILKQGRVLQEVNNFHYFPDKSKDGIVSQERYNTGKKSSKNSKSRTRYAEYNEKDETIDDQL